MANHDLGIPSTPRIWELRRAICHRTALAVKRYLDDLLHEAVPDYSVRLRFYRSMGYCHEYAWALTEFRIARAGIAIWYEDFLGRVLHNLGRALPVKQTWTGLKLLQPVLEAINVARQPAALRGFLTPQAKCLACEYQGAVEDSLPRLRQALGYIRRVAGWNTFVSLRQGIWTQLHHELTAFTSAHSDQASSEGYDLDNESWRAIASGVGERSAFRRSNHDSRGRTNGYKGE
jgi:hypothetical protein